MILISQQRFFWYFEREIADEKWLYQFVKKHQHKLQGI